MSSSRALASQTPPRSILILLFAMATMVGPMGMDLYLPSFHAIAQEFDVSAVHMQQSISVYMIAWATSTLFYGALSDTFGRRRVLLTTLGVYAVMSLACALSNSFSMLMISRLLQGLVAGAGMVITRAMVQDIYEGATARRMMALVMLFFGLGPCIAPILGGVLQTYLGWRSCFYFLAGFAGLLTVFAWRSLPETLAVSARTPLQMGAIGGNYLRAFRNPQFCAMAVGVGLMAGANSLYITSAAEFVINVLRLESTSYGWLFVPHVAGTMIGSMAASSLASRMSAERQTQLAYGGLFAAMSLNLLYNHFATQPQVPWAVLPFTVYSFSVALLLPVRSVQIINFFPGMKGMASSLQAFTQMFTFAVLSSMLVPLLFHSGWALAMGHAVCTVIGMVIWALAPRLAARPAAAAT